MGRRGQGDPAAALQHGGGTCQRGLLGCIGRRSLVIEDPYAGGLKCEFQGLLVKRNIDGGLAVHMCAQLTHVMGLRGAGSQQQE